MSSIGLLIWSVSSSNVNGPNDIHLRKKQRTEDKTRPAMLDFDILDCPVCMEPLTIPIFQCDNGHLACSSCCPKLSNKCPTCALPFGHNRCRAMETVLESIFVACQNAKFGCTKNVSYGKKSIHEKECIFSQCSCPALGCKYTASYKDLFNHYSNTHKRGYWGRYRCNKTHKKSYRQTYRCNRFRCGISFQVKMNISDKIVTIREFQMRLLFAVQCFREPCGVYVTVSCIAPPAQEVGQFSYRIAYTVDGHTVMYKSPKVKRTLKASFQTPHENFMFIPHSLLRGEKLEMKLCIKRKKVGVI